jgi:hypothetical protein
MSVPCTLVGTLRDRAGVLVLYRDRIEFLGQVGAFWSAGQERDVAV